MNNIGQYPVSRITIKEITVFVCTQNKQNSYQEHQMDNSVSCLCEHYLQFEYLLGMLPLNKVFLAPSKKGKFSNLFPLRKKHNG